MRREDRRLFATILVVIVLVMSTQRARAADLNLICSLHKTEGGSQVDFQRKVEFFFETYVVVVYDNYGLGFKPLYHQGKLIVADNSKIRYSWPDGSISEIDREDGSYYSSDGTIIIRGECSKNTPGGGAF